MNYVRSEVESRLKYSLHNRISIILDKDEDPANVCPFWDLELKFDTRKVEKIESGATIDKIYDRSEVNGKLLILGEPGSGKTTTLLKLARVLIERCEQDITQPIPVLFNLSSWTDDNQCIHDWVIDSLKADPYGIKKELSQKWLEEGVILPLFDGLDELSSSRQKPCINRLNEYLRSKRLGLPLVVCSRLQEFQNNQTPLNLNASIILQPLREEQIKDYIEKSEGIRLWEEIERNSDLLELSKIPLFLSVIVITCEEISFIKWQKLPSNLARKQYLFETYVDKMLTRKHKIKLYTETRTKKWLGWLAIQLIHESKTEFLIENIQPYWLKLKHEKLIYGLIYELINILIFVSISVLIFRPIRGLLIGLIGGLFFILINALTKDLDNIKTIETIQINLLKNRKKLINGLILGLINGLIAGLIQKSFIWLFIGLIYALIYVLIFGLIYGLSGAALNIKTYPNQGIQESINNALKIGLINVIILTAIVFPILQLIILPIINKFNLNESIDLLYRITILLIVYNIVIAILPVFKHLSLRIVIYLKNYSPWNYAKFLNYATDKLFLQRVGGGYKFIHRMLQEHFAQVYSNSTKDSD